ncbi:MAG: phosphoribosylglycinamide formyltransferase [Candidatus Izemoplasmatales bacterium]|nr:phosphoribosylglycinamide formyltransferase [Candidatus Izemoplasmatales bacterium]
MTKIAVFASGNGSNFEAIVTNASAYVVAVLIVDHKEAYASERAKRLDVPFYVVEPREFKSKREYEQEILRILEPFDVRWIALAGYMRICGPALLNAYPDHIINIHPALLPSFPGKDAIFQAINHHVKVTGVTIHFVDSGIDTGKIIAQAPYLIPEGADEETIRKGIQAIEHELYPNIINRLIKEESQ